MSRDGRLPPSPPRIEIRRPQATPDEAAAIAAAIEDFLRDTAQPPPATHGHSAWLRAGLLEGVGLASDAAGVWADPHPWGHRGG